MINKYSCIIIEDEPLALERAKNFVEKVSSLNLLSHFDNALDGLAFLKHNEVDILFLDINMDELSGIELLESFPVDSQIIFTTAYEQYAIKGYELNVTDYLLKPYSFPRFLQAVNKAQENIAKTTSLEHQDYIFIRTEHRLDKVRFEDILFVEGMRDYRRVHTINQKIMTLQTFSSIEKSVPSATLCRVHKSYMVALSKIDSIEKGRIKIAEKIIPISATYKDHFYKNLNLLS